MNARSALLCGFSPRDWREGEYARSPPFVVEETSEGLRVIPRDRRADRALGGAARSLGLRRSAGSEGYSVSSDGAKAVREFDWYLRRGWRDPDHVVLWAMLSLGERTKWTGDPPAVRQLALAAGIPEEVCRASLVRLFRSGSADEGDAALRDLAQDRRLIELTIEKRMLAMPSRTEEAVMEVLCSAKEASVEEVYESLERRGTGLGAAYKVVKRLRDEGYARRSRLLRVHRRGPMRVVMAPDCGNCFYGFTSEDTCALNTMRQIEHEVRRACGSGARSVAPRRNPSWTLPAGQGSRTGMRVLAYLRHVREMRRLGDDEEVRRALQALEAWYGVNLSLRRDGRRSSRPARTNRPSPTGRQA